MANTLNKLRVTNMNVKRVESALQKALDRAEAQRGRLNDLRRQQSQLYEQHRADSAK